jgi:DNA-binding MarR family transcriptional regulator
MVDGARQDPELTEAVRALARASDELSLAHYRVLAAIASGDERASRVATRLAIGRPTISAAVDALCLRGLLLRVGVQGDQRATALHLTEAGTSLLDRVEAAMTERLEKLRARTVDSDQLVASLIALGAAMDEVQAEQVARVTPAK